MPGMCWRHFSRYYPRMSRAPPAFRHLMQTDSDLARALAEVGPPPPRTRPVGFAGLVRIILAQQISAAAAATLWQRLSGAIDPFTPEKFARLSVDRLRALGLSRQKAAYAAGLASDIEARRVDLSFVHAADDEAAIAALTSVKGIGRWSAEIYLLFALRRPDVWPAGDLALAIAVQRLKRLRRRPDPDRLRHLAEPWRPYRSAAARLLWHYYAAAGASRPR